MSREHKLIFQGTSKQTNYVGGGKDGKEDYIIDCTQGDTIFVTEEKKTELLKDHPEWFVDPDMAEPPRAEPKVDQPPVGIDQAPELEKAIIESETFDYESMTNAELREIAGTDDKRLSKRKLIKLIKSKDKE